MCCSCKEPKLKPLLRTGLMDLTALNSAKKSWTGNTLTVLSGEELPDDFEEDDEDNESLEEKWTPRFSYGR
jgi:hypothetical protein